MLIGTGVVTISASYGCGGSEIGPAVAAELGLPFVDRAIPTAVARTLGVALEYAQELDEVATTGLRRLVDSMARVPDITGMWPSVVTEAVPPEEAFLRQTRDVLHDIAAGAGGAWAGPVPWCSGDAPRALHVRLDGPVEERIRRAIGIDRAPGARGAADTARQRPAAARQRAPLLPAGRDRSPALSRRAGRDRVRRSGDRAADREGGAGAVQFRGHGMTAWLRPS
jgi:hypothetical protein